MREVVITGLGFILPNCDSPASFWQHISGGESQLAFEPHPTRPDEKMASGRIRDFDPARYLSEIPERFYRAYHRELQYFLASVLLARDDAKLETQRIPGERMAVVAGSSRTMFEFWYDRIRKERDTPFSELYTRRELMTGLPGQATGIAASLLRVRGPAYTFAGTCSSGGIAAGHAWREIRDDEVDVAFVVGHDVCLVPALLAMYDDANLLSREQEDARRAVRPFVGSSTNAFGEGSVAMVLESREHAEKRGAPIIAVVRGYRYGNNGYHPTTVDVTGLRPAEVIRGMVERADKRLDDVDFVVGHGNAVNLSDVSEQNYMRQLFGARAREVPLISTKPVYGHLLGASSAINIAAAALMLKHGFLAPTLNIDETRLKRGTNHQPNRGEKRALRHGVTMSFGMGGHNAAMLLERYEPAAG